MRGANCGRCGSRSPEGAAVEMLKARSGAHARILRLRGKLKQTALEREALIRALGEAVYRQDVEATETIDGKD